MRTNMPSFGKRNPLKKEHFDNFVKAYLAEDRNTINDERWNCFTRSEIEEKGNIFDCGLIQSDDVFDYEALQDPIETGQECIAQLEEVIDLIQGVVNELMSIESEVK